MAALLLFSAHLHERIDKLRVPMAHYSGHASGPVPWLGRPQDNKTLYIRSTIMHRILRGVAVAFCLSLSVSVHAQTSGSFLTGPSSSPSAEKGGSNKQRPNILFIIMDDVGIDQMQIFGYGGATPPLTPNINAIARAGVRFRNTWSMPECSPSRAIFFEGRYPLRTNVNNAILSNDLANSQVSPFEVTTPQILRTKNYKSGLFGKFHLAGPDNNEFQNATPHVLGWDYFDGFLEGAMHPIDTTLGGQLPPPPQGPNPPPPTYSCGFVPNKTQDPANGADAGACVYANASCDQLTRRPGLQNPGFSCVQKGGIFVKNTACSVARTQPLNFEQTNAYYVWNRVINQENGKVVQYDLSDPRSRGYVSDATVSAAVDWIKQQSQAKKPWMTTVSFANDHTPYQQPPEYLLPSPTPDSTGFACTGNTTANEIATRILSNQMIEAMDTEIGNLMVSAGLARRKGNTIDYRPEETNTMVIIVGDNGTFAPGVKEPFDLNRAKGYVYQTGVWVPLIVAGPLVASPDREVKAMINITDLFQLFGEIAGADVNKIVPKSHILDSQPMLAYLTNPNQPSIRKTNFTQTASNIHPVDPYPCVITLTDPNTCVQLFNTKQLCNFEGGQWYGPNPDVGTTVYNSCCDVQRGTGVKNGLLPVDQQATRDDNYKLVRQTQTVCGGMGQPDTTKVVTEFYQIDEKPLIPMIDKADLALCNDSTTCPNGLTPEQVKIYNQLANSMTQTLGSEPPCKGDGNLDKQVNLEDVANWFYFANNGVKEPDGTINTSSWYDFNKNGSTDSDDLKTIVTHFGTNCLKKN